MIARDEEKLIGNAIASVKHVVDEIIVVDTGSKDRTADIARELGATVFHFDWNDDFSAARNFALEKVTSDWVFVLDADEELLPEQAPKLRKLSDSDMDAFIFIQKNFSNTDAYGFVPESRKGFKGFYPSFIIRMFRSGRGIKFDGMVHEGVDSSLALIKARIGLTDIGICHYQELKGDGILKDKQVKYAEIIEKNIDSFPNKAKAYHDIGIVYYRYMNDYKKALSCFENSVEINPKNAFVWNDLAAAYVQVNNPKKALEAFGKSLDLRRDPSTFYNIGLLQERLGDTEAAVLAYEEAIRFNHPKKAELKSRIDNIKKGSS